MASPNKEEEDGEDEEEGVSCAKVPTSSELSRNGRNVMEGISLSSSIQ